MSGTTTINNIDVAMAIIFAVSADFSLTLTTAMSSSASSP